MLCARETCCKLLIALISSDGDSSDTAFGERALFWQHFFCLLLPILCSLSLFLVALCLLLSKSDIEEAAEVEDLEIEEIGADSQSELTPARLLGAKRRLSSVGSQEEQDDEATPNSAKTVTKEFRSARPAASDGGKGGKGGEPTEEEPAADETEKLNPDLFFEKSESDTFYAKGGKKKVFFHQLLWDLQREHGQPRSLKQKIWMDYYRELLAGRLPTGPFSQCLGWQLNSMLFAGYPAIFCILSAFRSAVLHSWGTALSEGFGQAEGV